jgi:hypothetical protein
MIAEIIIEYGESRDAGDGARKYALTKQSMCRLRRHAGREIVKAIGPYRNRNAYVVAVGDRIVTIAYSPSRCSTEGISNGPRIVLEVRSNPARHSRR